MYIDCFSGVAGDMLLAALIDAGVSLMNLERELQRLKDIAEEWRIELSSVLRSQGQISAKYVKVWSKYGEKSVYPPCATPVSAECESSDAGEHSHDGQKNEPEQQLSDTDRHHDHRHDHHHQHHSIDHTHEHGGSYFHSHPILGPTRGLNEITSMILQSQLSDWVKAVSIAAFYELAVAEAKVHGSTVDQVHFHEVGAVSLHIPPRTKHRELHSIDLTVLFSLLD